ncbi:MAG: DNA polymerase III subunit delta [Oscillospiraceae bacterium]|nr:DNA polymerase III subunit delta [Oscillospiraceae bacterium]
MQKNSRKKTQNDSYPKLRQALKAGEIEGIYIFHGEERYLLEHSVSELRRIIVPEGTEEFNLRIFDGKVSAAEVVHAVDSMPAMSDKTLTIVRDWDIFSLGESESSQLAELFDDYPDYATLVFVYDTVEYKPDWRRKFAKKLKEDAFIVEFAKQEKNSLVRWLHNRFAALDKEISSADAEYLIFLSGGLMTALAGETEKLAAYQKGKTITRTDIDAVVIPVTEAVVFELGDALAARKNDRALEVLYTLLDSRESADKIMYHIGRQMRQLYNARLLAKQPGAAQKLMEQWGMKSQYPADKLIQNASRMSLKYCRQAVKLCAQADRDLKFSGDDKRLTLEFLILRMALIND